MKLKFLFLSLVFLLGTATAFSQSSDSFSDNWLLDYENALDKATEEGKYVLLFFTGSDWCPPCKRIKKDVYTSSTFKEYADEKLILVLADFPKRKANKLSPEQEAKNKSLARVFNPRGFPTTIIIDAEGNEIERWVGYDPAGANAYLEKFDNAMNL